LLVVAALLAGCSLLYDPGKLPSTDGDLSDAASVANENHDASSSGDDAHNDSGIQPMPDAPHPMQDAAPPKSDASPPMPDASPPRPDASPPMPDASPPMPDAGHCGRTDELCCSGMVCEPSNECSGGTCHHCGGSFESCCDPGMTCNGLLFCVAGVCTL
jgi:hypothetical protein